MFTTTPDIVIRSDKTFSQLLSISYVVLDVLKRTVTNKHVDLNPNRCFSKVNTINDIDKQLYLSVRPCMTGLSCIKLFINNFYIKIPQKTLGAKIKSYTQTCTNITQTQKFHSCVLINEPFYCYI